jgi:UDP-N-acetylmuramoylalanine--D-glutamate ligase
MKLSKDWNGLKVVIVGAARQGLALARYLAIRGARVVINDQMPADKLVEARRSLEDLSAMGIAIEWVFEGHPLSILKEIDLLCPSGGVPLSNPLIIEARQRGIPLSNDSQIFLESAPCKVIGITGSAGKTTTTTLVGRIAEKSLAELSAPYRQVWIGGNIGVPLLSSLAEIQSEDLAIMELSSFQLEIMNVSPHIAVVLNITPNHLDRHKTMQDYIDAKARILDFQSKDDIAILGRDDPGAWSLKSKAHGRTYSFGISDIPADQEGAFYYESAIHLHNLNGQNQEAVKHQVMKADEISLRGEHNLVNVIAACTISAAAGLSINSMRKGVIGFKGVNHRLEFVRSWGGADWYNDSVATAPERVIAAIHSFEEPLVLLAGGRDKNLSWNNFAILVQCRVDHLVVFGEAAEKIINAITLTPGQRTTITRCKTLKQAVQAAAIIIREGDVVLLSPGGTSFDEFKDFEERGRCFTQWVNELT